MNFRQMLAQDRPVLGMYVSCPDLAVAEIIVRSGIDYIRIDLEHGMLDYTAVANLVRLSTIAGIPVQARVSDLSDITRLLDLGVTGIFVPDVETAEYAKKLVEKVKYAPLGMRGMNNNPRFLNYNSAGFQDYVKTANEEVLLGIQLESRTAVEHIDEILSVEGIDMVSSGKGDLSQSYGVAGNISHPVVVETENYILRKAIEHGKIPTALSTSAERTAALYRQGVRMVTIGTDLQVIRDAMCGMTAAHRACAAGAGEKGEEDHG